MTAVSTPAIDALVAALSNVATPIVVMDAAGQPIAANPTAVALLGPPPVMLSRALDGRAPHVATPSLTSPGLDLSWEHHVPAPSPLGEAADGCPACVDLTVRVMPLPEIGTAAPTSCLILQQRAPVNDERTELARLYHLFFDRMPSHSYVHRPTSHPDNGLLLYSPQLTSVIGHPPELWINDREFREQLVHPEDRAKWRAAYTAVTPATRTFCVEFRIQNGFGECRWIRDQAVRVTDESGEDYWLGYLGDITAEKDAEARVAAAMAELAEANQELSRLSQRKSEFVTMISHEFRTPLTSIQGFSELLIDEAVPADESSSFLQAINSSAQHLARMINDVLELDRLEHARTRLNVTLVDLSAVAREVLASMRPMTSRHQLVAQLAPAMPLVAGDRDHLLRVVTNLMANAVKYSPAGSNITVTTYSTPSTIELRIADHGLGVPHEDRERVFDRYDRINRREQATIHGLGLGLPIARQIVDRHDGRIWLDGNGEVGTIACVSLPIAGRPG